MPEIKPLKIIHQSFMELPEKVRDWLTSERVTYTIIEINKKLDLFGSLLTVIPNLITKLVTKNLDPKNFTKELEDGLGIDGEQAQEITREIMEKILRPIDLPLKETGVFVGLIYGSSTTATTPAPKPPTPPAPVVPPVPPRPTAQPPVRPTPVPSTVPPISPAMPTAPKPPVPPVASPTQSPESIQSKVIPIPIKRPPGKDEKLGSRI